MAPDDDADCWLCASAAEKASSEPYGLRKCAEGTLDRVARMNCGLTAKVPRERPSPEG
jgi:hypothetical protein